MSKRRIGIFGGSFNPVHNGHIHICNAFLKSNLIDELWVIPVYDPPHKPSELLVPYVNRLEMTRLAFEKMSNVNVSEVESELSRPNYTLKTIEYFQSKYPDSKFYLCIGGDSLTYFHTWFKYKQLIELVNLIVVNRDNSSFSGVESIILQRTHFIQCDITPESSIDIRAEIAEKGNTTQVPPAVMDYIRKFKLYGLVSD